MRKILPALLLVPLAFAADPGSPRPKVRAVTAFIRIDPQSYEAQYADAMQFLNAARDAYRAAGFEVEGVRIATQPFPEYIHGMPPEQALAFLRKIDALAARLNFAANIGPAMLADADDTGVLDVLAKVLATTNLASSLSIAGEDGIHWRAVRAAAKLVKTVSQTSPNGRGNLDFAATAMMKPFGPFYPGSYGTGEGRAFAVALEGASVVEYVFARYRDPRQAERQLAAALAMPLAQAEAVATSVAAKSGWRYAGIDPTPAPLGDVSIARAIESFTGAPFGSAGTMTAAAIITRAVRSVPVKQTGYSGLMVPVLEDNLLARRWEEGTFNLDSLLAYSSVCAAGLDTIPLHGDIGENELARIMGDVASLAFKWNKPLAARLLPVPGAKPGDRTDFHHPRMHDTVVR